MTTEHECPLPEMVRLAPIPGDVAFKSLGPMKCLSCGWTEPRHECSPSCPGYGTPQ